MCRHRFFKEEKINNCDLDEFANNVEEDKMFSKENGYTAYDLLMKSVGQLRG